MVATTNRATQGQPHYIVRTVRAVPNLTYGLGMDQTKIVVLWGSERAGSEPFSLSSLRCGCINQRHRGSTER